MAKNRMNSQRIISVFIALVCGACFAFIVFVVKQQGESFPFWEISSTVFIAVASLMWESWKSFKAEQKEFREALDLRLDKIESDLLNSAKSAEVHGSLQQILADVAVSRSMAERATTAAETSQSVSAQSQLVISQFISSGTVPKLVEDVTALKMFFSEGLKTCAKRINSSGDLPSCSERANPGSPHFNLTSTQSFSDRKNAC